VSNTAGYVHEAASAKQQGGCEELSEERHCFGVQGMQQRKKSKELPKHPGLGSHARDEHLLHFCIAYPGQQLFFKLTLDVQG